MVERHDLQHFLILEFDEKTLKPFNRMNSKQIINDISDYSLFRTLDRVVHWECIIDECMDTRKKKIKTRGSR